MFPWGNFILCKFDQIHTHKTILLVSLSHPRWRKNCWAVTSRFLAVSFIIAKGWQQLRCPQRVVSAYKLSACNLPQEGHCDRYCSLDGPEDVMICNIYCLIRYLLHGSLQQAHPKEFNSQRWKNKMLNIGKGKVGVKSKNHCPMGTKFPSLGEFSRTMWGYLMLLNCTL